MDELLKSFKKSEIFKHNNWITFFLFNLMSAMDDPERITTISIEDARLLAEEKNLVSYLQSIDDTGFSEVLDEERNLSLKDSLNEWIHEVALGLWGRERKKMGIENNGFLLISSYLIELMQWVGRIAREN